MQLEYMGRASIIVKVLSNCDSSYLIEKALNNNDRESSLLGLEFYWVYFPSL
jgi:hypothetical protein